MGEYLNPPSMAGQPRVAIAIPSYLREQVLLETLRQVVALDPPADEVLVIDQTAEHEPETDLILRAWDQSKTIRWIKHSPANLPGARNRAVSECSCDIIIFIDDDVNLPVDFVARHVAAHREAHFAAITGPVYGPLLPGKPSREGTGNSVDVEPVVQQDHLYGGNFSIRKGIFVACGGFDEQYVASANYEENDFARRLMKSGYKIGYAADACLLHLKAPSGGCRIPGNRRNAEWTKSVCYLLFAFRHAQSAAEFGSIFWGALRAGPLRKENILKPWLLPVALLSFVYAAAQGFKRSRKRVQSPFA